MKRIKFYAAGLAVVLAVCSAFTNVSPKANINGDVDTWYQYNGLVHQTSASRMDASNYIKIIGDPGCTQNTNECGVELNQDFGTTPDFTNVSFDTNGFPDGGSAFVSNEKKN